MIRRPGRKSTATASALATAAALVSLGCWVLTADPGAPVASPGRDGRATTAVPDREPEIVRELRELRAGLERLAPAATREMATLTTATTDPAIRSELTSLRQEMQELREAVARPPLLRRTPCCEHLQEALRQHPDTQWHAVTRLLEQWRTNPVAARRAVRLRTPAELVERFGPPVDVRAGDGGELGWVYDPRGTGAGDTRRLTLEVVQGLVTGLRVVDTGPPELARADG